MLDCLGRQIHYLRLSITDRCNLRCRYCMPNGVNKCAHEDLLSYEDMEKVVRALAELGIDTVRLTGGEPLVRRDVEVLLKMIKEIPGIQKVSMTTNGVLLKQKLPLLLENGLDSVNISLDTLDENKFKQITGYSLLHNVMEGIEAAIESKISVKINCVPQIGINDQELIDIAMLAKDWPIEVRFIEIMPIGEGNEKNGINNEKLFLQFQEKLGMMNKVEHRDGNGPAVCYRVNGFRGSIGFISAMHGKFCGECNRIRLTSKGFLKCCLASNSGADLRELLEQNVSLEQLKEVLSDTIYHKPIEHHFEIPGKTTEKNGMYAIGG